MTENKRIFRIEKGPKYTIVGDMEHFTQLSGFHKVRFVDIDTGEQINPGPYLSAYSFDTYSPDNNVTWAHRLFYLTECEGNKLDTGKFDYEKIKVKVKPDSNRPLA